MSLAMITDESYAIEAAPYLHCLGHTSSSEVVPAESNLATASEALYLALILLERSISAYSAFRSL